MIDCGLGKAWSRGKYSWQQFLALIELRVICLTKIADN
jgi:hypothetical protein